MEIENFLGYIIVKQEIELTIWVFFTLFTQKVKLSPGIYLLESINSKPGNDLIKIYERNFIVSLKTLRDLENVQIVKTQIQQIQVGGHIFVDLTKNERTYLRFTETSTGNFLIILWDGSSDQETPIEIPERFPKHFCLKLKRKGIYSEEFEISFDLIKISPKGMFVANVEVLQPATAAV